MRDTYRRYRAIARCLLQLYRRVSGHERRHLHTLTLLYLAARQAFGVSPHDL